MFVDTFSDHRITYLYFIRTIIQFSYVMFTENLNEQITVHLCDILHTISSGKIPV